MVTAVVGSRRQRLLTPVYSVLFSSLALGANAREFTEAHAIEMTSLGDPDYWHHNQSFGRVAHYSPDKTQMIVVLRRGNLAEGTTEYSLLLYRSKELLRTPPPAPQVILRMSSSSNREGLVSLKWLPDNRTVLFLGENPGEERQVYRLDITTRALERLTHSKTSLLSYSASADGASILYLADKPQSPVWNSETRRRGVLVSNQYLRDLMVGRYLPLTNRGDLYLQSMAEGSEPKRIDFEHEVDGGFPPSISPDGRHALVRLFPMSFPQKWRDYSDFLLQSSMPKQALARGETSGIAQFIIIDTQTAAARTLLDAPQIAFHGSVDAIWAPDSTSVLVTLLYLPLDQVSPKERQRRASSAFLAEIDLSGGVRPLVPQSLMEMASSGDFDRLEGFESETNIAVLMRQSPQGVRRSFFEKQQNGWRGIAAPRTWRGPLEVSLKEGMNLPPRLVVFDPGARRESTLLDLNPQLKDLKLARQEEVAWQATDGTRVRGGLYYPPDYVRGRRYPLVIQTHGWSPRLFAADGIFVSAFAAQALANKNIMVLQAWDFPEEDNAAAQQRWAETKLGKVAMHQFEQSVYEGAVDHLDSAGLIDRTKVGLIGFSYTCWSVKYALSHPRPGYRYAAAAVSDGYDGSYFSYLAYGNKPDAQLFERVNGGKPYGPEMQAWLKESPAFNVERVDTPLRMIPLENPGSLLNDWEWFVLLRRMGKPVELVMIEDGSHSLVKPWDRMVASGGNVDWFDFWLNNHKGNAAEKAEQYARWEKMRP